MSMSKDKVVLVPVFNSKEEEEEFSKIVQENMISNKSKENAKIKILKRKM